MNTTTQRIAAVALAVLLSGGLVACGDEAPAPRQQVDTVDAPAANVPQVESGFGPRKEHWAPATDAPAADPYGESGFGPKRDIYGESGFGPRR